MIKILVDVVGDPRQVKQMFAAYTMLSSYPYIRGIRWR